MLELGRHDEAVAAYRRCVEGTHGVVGLGYLGQALGRAGREGEARAHLTRLHEIARTRYLSPLDFALTHAGLGEVDATFDSLDRAYDDRAADLSRIKLLPWPDPIRKDARFAALVARLGLTP